MSYEAKILNALKESESGLSALEVSKKTGLSKTAVVKYLATFRMAGKADYVERGPSRLWRLITPRRGVSTPTLKGERLDDILRRFMESVELEGSAVANSQGLVISAILPENIDRERMESLSSTLIRAGLRSVELAELERLEYAVIEGRRGSIILSNGDRAILIAFSKPQAPVGTIKYEMKEFLKIVDEALA